MIRRAICVAVAALLAWIAFSTIAAPRIIEAAYRQESFEFLNRVISGRQEHPLSEYQDQWRSIRWKIAVVVVVLSGAAVLSFPRLKSLRHARDFHGMSPARMGIAYGVVGFIAFGSLYDIATYTEHWPFSNYPMYSKTRSTQVSSMTRAYVITERGDELYSKHLFEPFDPSRLSSFFLDERLDLDEKTAAARCLLDLARKNGRPDAAGVAIYRCEWTHEPQALNWDAPQRTKVIEYMSPSGAAQ